ncbi:hypothetical protein KIN20_003649, partial [Parelaphostrongylus tenuis]
PPFESIEIENDENIPPVGDTVGRRLSKRTSKPISSAFQSSERTPLKMKIAKSNNTARISSYTVKYRSPSIKEYKCVRAPDDAKILPITVRFRSVLQRSDGSVEYRTVGPDSPWGMKRPVARIIPAKLKLSKLVSGRKRNSAVSVDEYDNSSSSEDCSSDDRDEIDESSSYSEELDIIKEKSVKRRVSRRISDSRKTIRRNTAATISEIAKRKNVLEKPKIETGEAGMLGNLLLRLHTAEVPDHMPCREEVRLDELFWDFTL